MDIYFVKKTSTPFVVSTTPTTSFTATTPTIRTIFYDEVEYNKHRADLKDRMTYYNDDGTVGMRGIIRSDVWDATQDTTETGNPLTLV